MVNQLSEYCNYAYSDVDDGRDPCDDERYQIFQRHAPAGGWLKPGTAVKRHKTSARGGMSKCGEHRLGSLRRATGGYSSADFRWNVTHGSAMFIGQSAKCQDIRHETFRIAPQWGGRPDGSVDLMGNERKRYECYRHDKCDSLHGGMTIATPKR